MYKTSKKYFCSTISSSRLKGLLISYISMCFLEKLAFLLLSDVKFLQKHAAKVFFGSFVHTKKSFISDYCSDMDQHPAEPTSPKESAAVAVGIPERCGKSKGKNKSRSKRKEKAKSKAKGSGKCEASVGNLFV